MLKFIVKKPDQGEKSFVVREDDVFIGRIANINDLCLNDPSVSRQHAHVKVSNEGYIINDLKSLNGVVLNGKRVSKAILKTGDVLRLGNVEIQVEVSDGEDDVELDGSEKDILGGKANEVTQIGMKPTKKSK